MASRSVLQEAREVQLAVTLIELGARLQFLEAEVDLSRERLVRLYKEIKGASPPKGLLPFSTDWYMTWMANIHASLFMALYNNLIKASALDDVDAIVKAYRLYKEQCAAAGLAEELSITRAWRLVRFVDAGMLKLTACTKCSGRFVIRDHDLTRHYVCGLCHVPSRAGRTKDPALRLAH